MKNSFLLVFCIGIIFLLQSKSNAQWEQIGPSGGNVTKFSVIGNKIYAAAYGGVLVSSDGKGWDHSNWGLMDGDILSVTATSTRVFAGTRSNGIFYKDINGLIWAQTSLTDIRIDCLASIGNYVFAGTYSEGIYLSSDNGSTWAQANNGLTELQIFCFTVIGTNIFTGTSSGKVFLSTNMGTSWTSVSTGLPDNVVISLAFNGTELYAGVWGNGIYKSTNNGQGWVSFGQPVNYPSSFAFRGTDVYVSGGGHGIYRTSNNGLDWDRLDNGTNGIPVEAAIYPISFINGNLVAGEDHVWGGIYSQGIYVSTNYGENWTHINWGLPNYCTNGITASSGNILAATGSGIYRSTNEGIDWDNPTMHGEHDWADFSAISFRGNNYVFAGDINGYTYVSTNAGQNFTLKPQLQHGATITSFAFIGTNVFASTKPYAAGVAGGVYLSSDNGENWSLVNNGLPTLADTNTVVSSLAVIGSNLFAGTGHGVYMSSNNGTNWTPVNNGLTSFKVTSIIAKGTELFAGTFDQGVFRSNDNGVSWSLSLPNKNVTALALIDTNVFAGTQAQGIYWMLNIDSTWRYRGLSNVYVTSFTVSNQYLYAATSHNSVWRNSLSILTNIKETKNGIPAEFILSQNYPNPFNPTTKISWQSPVASQQTIKVYDVLGNEIETLVNEYLPAGGYDVDFNAKNLSSGIYFYRIQIDKYSETRKMILLR